MHAREYPFITEIADIDMYEPFAGYETIPLSSFTIPAAKVFSAEELLRSVVRGHRRAPFTGR